jgi:hypothetical protein
VVSVAVLAACSGEDPTSTASTASTAPAPVVLETTTSAPPASFVVTTVPEITATSATVTTQAVTSPPSAPTTVPSTTSTTLPPEPRTSCQSVIHVGDSTSVSLISPSYLSDPEQRVDAQYRRVGALDARTVIDGALSTTEVLNDEQVNAFDRVSAIKADGYEGCWVFALGGNDTANVSVVDGTHEDRVARIERMMSAIGDDPVMWVNVFTLKTSGAYRNENMVLWNEALQEVLPRYPNMRVYDWASAVQEQWFQDDDIHYTSAGSAWRAALIANALAEAFPA